MPITINGSGTITGISAGGLPDSVVTTDDIANSAVTDAKIAAVAASKLTGAVAVSNGGTGLTAAPPAFSAYRSSDQTGLSSGVYTKVQLNAELFDTASAFDSSTNYRFTPQVAGYYQFNGQISAYAGGGGAALNSAYVLIKKNGTTYYDGNYLPTSNASNQWTVVVSNILYMNGTTDYVELWGYLTGTGIQFSGGASGGVTYFSGALVRSA
jgi:hypothetical protein